MLIVLTFRTYNAFYNVYELLRILTVTAKSLIFRQDHQVILLNLRQ
jgi:hypothetical protein